MHRRWAGLLVGLSPIVIGPVAVAPSAPHIAGTLLPVVACQTAVGVEGQAAPGIPTQLATSLPARTAGRLRFYSDGYMVLLGPSGWTCAGIEAADGGMSLSVFPTRQSDPLTTGTPAADAAAVTGRFDYTGHGPGAELVCALFPSSHAATLSAQTGGCPPVPRREVVKRPARDLARFVDPPKVMGSGEPSGGTNPASGAVLFPQLTPEPASVDIAKVTCTAPKPTARLCPAIVSDFVARARVHPSG